MSERKLADTIVRKRMLMVFTHSFYCPYCDHQFRRGGSKEGFVKSGAYNHVAACYEILLFLKGYIAVGGGGPEDNRTYAMPIAEYDNGEKGRKRVLRGIKANLRRRKNDDEVPQ